MIRGHRLKLRALERQDLAFLHRLHNSFQNMSYFFEEPFETLRELEDLYEKHVHNQTERRFVLEEVVDGQSVGVLSLIEIDDINRKCEIDIIIDERFQGRGYGKDGFTLGVKYAFDILNIYKIYLILLPGNFPGLKIYQYVGFKKEATLKREFYRNGEYVNVHRMCMFENQWRRERSRLQADIGFDTDLRVLIAGQAVPGQVPIPTAAPLQVISAGKAA